MFSWEIIDYYHGEDLPKHPDSQILETWKKEAEKKKNEEDEP